MAQYAPQRQSFRSASPQQIAEYCRTTLGWQLTFQRADWTPGEFRLDAATLGGLTTGSQRTSIGCAGTTENADTYVCWVSTRGRSAYEQGREQYVSELDHMLTYTPGERSRVAMVDAGTESTYLMLEPWVLERHLEHLLERPVSGPITLAPMTHLRLGIGRSLWPMVQLLNTMLVSPDHLSLHPAVVDPLREAVMTSLLLSVDHQYRDALARPSPPCRPRHVRRAVEAIHDSPERPYTVATLANLAGVGVRTLQEGFSTHLNTTPIAYLRYVRLACAHDELSGNGRVGVAEVACRWGFTHLGRFAAAYAKQYGQLPSHTGRRGTAQQPRHLLEQTARQAVQHQPGRAGGQHEAA